MVSSLYSEFPGGQTLRKVLFFLQGRYFFCRAVIFFVGALVESVDAPNRFVWSFPMDFIFDLANFGAVGKI